MEQLEQLERLEQLEHLEQLNFCLKLTWQLSSNKTRSCAPLFWKCCWRACGQK